MSESETITPTRVKVSTQWKRFILYVQNQCPEGQVSVKVSNGMPTELVEAKRRVRFDRPEPTSPVTFGKD